MKRYASVVSLLWSTLLLTGLLWTGLSVSLRANAEAVAAPLAPSVLSTHSAIAVYVLQLMLLNELGSAPIACYAGFLLERRYGLSNERFGTWLRDRVKSFAIGLVLAAGGALLVYSLIAWSPQRWWLTAGIACALLLITLTQLMPVVLLPLFYRLKPIENESLRARLLTLADRAGTRVLGAYEWGLGDKTRKANAALAGLGPTRRILVSDTMLADYTDEEIEVVLAHEIAHHVHGDIWKGIAFESGLTLGGFFLAAQLLQAMAVSMGLHDVADVAGLPFLLLAAGGLSLLMVPAAHAMSRAYERNADRFALNLTRNPQAFVSAMRRLGAQNLAEERPSKVVQWLFYSHPPLRDRIAAAEAFAARG